MYSPRCFFYFFSTFLHHFNFRHFIFFNFLCDYIHFVSSTLLTIFSIYLLELRYNPWPRINMIQIQMLDYFMSVYINLRASIVRILKFIVVFLPIFLEIANRIYAHVNVFRNSATSIRREFFFPTFDIKCEISSAQFLIRKTDSRFGNKLLRVYEVNQTLLTSSSIWSRWAEEDLFLMMWKISFCMICWGAFWGN